MKIAVSALQVSEKNSGIGAYIINILSALMMNVPNSYYIFCSRGVGLKPWREKNNVVLREVSFGKRDVISRNLFELFGVGQDVRNYGADIFFAPDTKLPWGLGNRCKKIITVHDLAVFKYPETYQRSRVIYWQKYFSSSVKRADKIIAISNATKNDLREVLNVPEDKIRVIYNGVSKDFNTITDAKELSRVRTKYQLPKQFILFVGTFSPRKNLGRLIEAFGLLKRDNIIPHKLVIAGEKGWKFQQDLDLVKSLKLEKQIFFPGYILSEDLPMVYGLADVLAYPSLYEGFGLPPLEAMACGTPVVASKTSSLPEVVGNAGILVDPFSVESIAKGLYSVLGDKSLHSRISLLGKERAKMFCWEQAALAVNDLFLSCVGT